MDNDILGIAAGLGIGIVVIGIIVYLGIIALCLWIGYLIMRTAVKNGVLLADAEIARRGGRGPLPGQTPQYSPPGP